MYQPTLTACNKWLVHFNFRLCIIVSVQSAPAFAFYKYVYEVVCDDILDQSRDNYHIFISYVKYDIYVHILFGVCHLVAHLIVNFAVVLFISQIKV